MPELLVTPAVSPRSVAGSILHLNSDAFIVDGVDLVIGTSSFLREHSHGKDMVAIEKAAIEVINYVKRYVPG